MSKDTKPERSLGAADAETGTKEARLAEALRANLKRRKSAQKKPTSPKTSP